DRWLADGRPTRIRTFESILSTSTGGDRSEEHTSELQSRQYLVCRPLLEKKKNARPVGLVLRALLSRDRNVGCALIDRLVLFCFFLFFMLAGPPSSTLFPYTTLFR